MPISHYWTETVAQALSKERAGKVTPSTAPLPLHPQVGAGLLLLLLRISEAFGRSFEPPFPSPTELIMGSSRPWPAALLLCLMSPQQVPPPAFSATPLPLGMAAPISGVQALFQPCILYDLVWPLLHTRPWGPHRPCSITFMELTLQGVMALEHIKSN